MKTKLAILVVFCMFFLAGANRAEANGGCYGCGGLGYGYGVGLLYNSLDFNVPYYAAHPPVYYSYPVPRTYGHSPFAYPPHFRTPDMFGMVDPVIIENPHVESSWEEELKEKQDDAASRFTSQQRPPQPLVIENPHCRGSVSVAQTAP